MPVSIPAVIYSAGTFPLQFCSSKSQQLLEFIIPIHKLTLGLLLPLLVAPLVGAAGASGMEPLNPRGRATEAETECDITMYQTGSHYMLNVVEHTCMCSMQLSTSVQTIFIHNLHVPSCE